MSYLNKQRAFALATLAWRMGEGEEPAAADYGVDYFSAAAIDLMVHRVFEDHVLARTRALAPLLANGSTFRGGCAVDCGPVRSSSGVGGDVADRAGFFPDSFSN